MPVPRKNYFALDYDACTVAELETFIKARTGSRPKPRRKKQSYVNFLRKADFNAIFRFLDLPPELRNFVYREPLPLDHGPNKRACHPSLLAVCQQLHSEAGSVLYGGSPVEIRLVFRAQQGYAFVECGLRATIDTRVHWVDDAVSGALRRVFDEWPAYLRRLQYVRIRVIFDSPTLPSATTSGSLFAAANYVFYSLCTHLAVSNKLKDLKLDIEGDATPGCTEKAVAILEPFQKLGPKVAKIFNITGVPEQACNSYGSACALMDVPKRSL